MATYTVRPGDTLSDIAARFNTSVAILADLNEIRNVHMIPVGLELTLPNGAGGNGQALGGTEVGGAFTVGSGIRQAMAADGTTAASDEVYHIGNGPDVQWSEAIGQNGTVYRLIKTTGRVHRFRPS